MFMEAEALAMGDLVIAGLAAEARALAVLVIVGLAMEARAVAVLVIVGLVIAEAVKEGQQKVGQHQEMGLLPMEAIPEGVAIIMPYQKITTLKVQALFRLNIMVSVLSQTVELLYLLAMEVVTELKGEQ